MAEGIILRHGNAIDDSELTATPPMVRNNKRFIGFGGEEQIGTADEIQAESRTLPIGGSLPIKAGIHDGAGTVVQNVPTMDGVTIYPTANAQTVEVGGKYMKGDVETAPLTNLLPQYIKKNVIIRVWNGANFEEIKGTYEGYH
ncbi:hypothetical protein [Clostridium sp. HBUAS56010]|uniref:hypothetical protein n=1 Tax=Clostridium sp. HBUAS56010 TaxID=2571127 RepID=UPI001178B335|nr:hypothetical protein [Clostridium sp. HBUAS56010]